MKKLLLLIMMLGFVSFEHSFAQQDKEGIDPEAASGLSEKSKFTSTEFMVAAANPHAVEAGYQMIKQGGSAVDAMIATQLVLNLVEPQSSGIGGGAFALYFDNASHELTTFDGRETAPAAVTSDLFMKTPTEPMKFWDAVIGGMSVATPGTLMLMEDMHKKYGKLPWKDLFQPAILLAENGFEVSPRLEKMITEDKYLKVFPETTAYFHREDGTALKTGDLLKNPEFANTLKAIAANGSRAFYDGKIADDIVRTVRAASQNPGQLSLADLKNYKVVERKPLCRDYRGYYICGMPAPTSGGITLLQILGVLENFDLGQYDPLSKEAIHLFAEANKLAYADRGKYIADPDFVDVPTDEMLDRNYLKQRAGLVKMNKTMNRAEPGQLPHKVSKLWAVDASLELPGTSHIVIVDKEGNALSMTTTIESGFGSHLMTNGFLLNNEMTDFSFLAEKNGQKIANRVEAGKRPRSSMAPVIIFDKPLSDKTAKPIMLVGSPGGSRIINYVAKTIIAVLDWKLDIQQAMNLPHFVNRNSDMDLEEGTDWTDIQKQLEALGHKVSVKPLTSGLHGIVIRPDGFVGGADPRREGIAKGD